MEYIEKMVSNIASKLGVGVTGVTVIDGEPVGCLDVYLVRFNVKSKVASTLVYKAELGKIDGGGCSDLLKNKIQHAINNLHSR